MSLLNSDHLESNSSISQEPTAMKNNLTLLSKVKKIHQKEAHKRLQHLRYLESTGVSAILSNLSDLARESAA